jgi:hypothetical protein
MNTTQKNNASLREQLDALGITVQEGEEDERQVSDAHEAKEDAIHMLPMVRAWLGNTALRDLYIARQRNDKDKKIQIALQHYAETLSRPEVMLQYFKIYILRMCGPNVKTVDPETGAVTETNDKAQKALLDLEFLKQKPEGWVMSKWALLRALNAAIRRTNYGHFMNKRGWIYTGDSDHKITVTMLTGQYKWTDPNLFSIGTVDATTEEEYIKPYDLRDIPNPDNPDEVIKCRVYRKVGNVVHPSSNEDQISLMENDQLIKGLLNLEPGKVIHKKYDGELHVSAFEEQAERDVDFLMEKAAEAGIRIWPAINAETRSVYAYHAGEMSSTGIAPN